MAQPILTLGPVARARNGVIGRDGGLPWRLSDDLKRFKALTLGKPIIMGRKTWQSLPKRPLPGRLNLILTRDGSYETGGAVVCETFTEAFAIAKEQAAEDGPVDVYVSKFTPMRHTLSGRARKSMLKLIVDQASQKVVGAHMLGEDAPEIMQGLGIAIVMGATKADFDRTFALHPTTAEELMLLR